MGVKLLIPVMVFFLSGMVHADAVQVRMLVMPAEALFEPAPDLQARLLLFPRKKAGAFTVKTESMAGRIKDPAEQDKLVDLLKKTADAAIAKRYSRAARFARKAARRFSRNPDALYAAALVDLQAGRTASAISRLRNALKRNTRFAAARIALGMAYMVSGNTSRAFAELSKAPRENADVLTCLGSLRFARQATAGRQDITAALDRRSDAPLANYLAGAMALLDGKLDEASYRFRIYLKTDSDNPVVNMHEAYVLVRQRKFQMARPMLRFFSRLDNASAYAARAAVLWSGNEQSAAATAARKALARSRAEPVALWINGAFLVNSGKARQAVQYLRQAVAAMPGDAYARFYHGLAMLEKGRYQAALMDIRKAEELLAGDKSPREFSRGMGIALNRNRQPLKAVRYLRRAAILEPGRFDVHYELGIALLAAGQIDSAIRAFAGAVRINPRHADSHFRLGYLYLHKKGWTKEAVKELEKAVKYDPKKKQYWQQLSKAYRKKGLRAASKKAHDRAMKLR